MRALEGIRHWSRMLGLHGSGMEETADRRLGCGWTSVSGSERCGGRRSGQGTVSKIPIKVDGVKEFSFEELASATSNFSSSSQVGQGGYGKVYRGVLADGTVVAVKRALEDSLQGSKEFFTEIELLSRLHHRNLVSLIGYCDDENEQVCTPCSSTFEFV
ncbi:putative LRR receptor-like serine/threonine-protein kinase [Platanthera guangdongensis]|uniref:LRR receptor-like serine/threonine-protein kinase n=1 Tax=Platanthera guangdongensis TaxID=2320717 RepID=A0ABR2MC12_9ASPA